MIKSETVCEAENIAKVEMEKNINLGKRQQNKD